MKPVTEASRLPWYRRLSIRLALVLGLALLSVEFVVTPLYETLVRGLGWPPPSEVYIWDPVPEDAGMSIDEALDQIGDAMLLGAIDPMTGEVSPTDEAYALVERMMVNGEGYVWLDADNRIANLSPWLPWPRGSTWEFTQESHTDIELDETGRMAHVIYAPKKRASAHVGTLVMVSAHEADGGHICAGTIDPNVFTAQVISDDEQLVATLAQQSLVTRVLSIGGAVVATMALLMLLSRLVTRRVARLARQAAQPGAGGEEVPGPFVVEGNDEIAVLAHSMNGMRDRVNELLGGLAERDVRRREWVAQVSHDLRTPLTALMACLDRAEGLLDHQPADQVDELREMIHVARYDADRVKTLAEDLLEIARLEAADALLLEPVPPGELVQQAARGLGPAAEANGIRLEADVAPVLPTVEADGRRLMRALENLMRNAIQNAGSLVQLTVSRQADALRFTVRDDGPGLPEVGGRVDLAALSELPRRADSSGLGLRVTRRVAEAHGGRIGGANRGGGGAEVWFEIPVNGSNGNGHLAIA